MSETKDIVDNPMRLSISIIEESLKKLRSHSTKNPFLNELEYCLDFVPKLKPKKIDSIPSPMILNSKSRKNKKQSTRLSCPEHIQEVITKGAKILSINEHLAKFSLDKEDIIEDDPYFHEEPMTEKLESEVKPANDNLEKTNKNESVETNKIFQNLNDTDDEEDEEDEELLLNLNKRAISDYAGEKNIFDNQTDEYELVKASSYETSTFDFHKTRANSILRTLEAGCKNFRMDDD